MGVEVRLCVFPAAALILAFGPAACRLEPPDPASQAAAILHKHPSDFLDQLASLDALAVREVNALGSSAGGGSGEDVRPLLAESLYAYAQRLRPTLAAIPEAGATSDSSHIAVLNAFLFDTLRIRPLLDSAPLASSVPSLILARRQGSCVGLVLLYLALGKSLDIPLAPVFLPGHMAVRHVPPGRPARNIETLRGGIARTDSFYREAFSLGKRPWYSLKEAAPEKALAALVFNLGNARRASGDVKSAAEEYRLAEEALPGFPEALGNQGVCFMTDGDKAKAREKFVAALAGDSLAAPALRNLDLLDGTAQTPE
jgi:regulator of sirC expression with transglutaminase-like and TPR domain